MGDISALTSFSHIAFVVAFVVLQYIARRCCRSIRAILFADNYLLLRFPMRRLLLSHRKKAS